MSRNRRRFGRHEVEEAQGTIGHIEARVVDISLEGLSIQVGEPLQVGQSYQLSLRHQERAVPIEGAVAWCSLLDTRQNEAGELESIYRVGIHIEKILSGRALNLYKFIEEQAVVDAGMGVFGCFTVEPGEGLPVGLVADFSVRKISLSGMVFETDSRPEVGSVIQMRLLLGERELEAQGRIVRAERVEPSAGFSFTQIAVEFVELADESWRAFADYIRGRLTWSPGKVRSSLREMDNRSTGRAAPDPQLAKKFREAIERLLEEELP